MRGLAVLAVVLFHFAPGIAPGGFLGVDVFFVLSGFLITSLLVTEWETTHRVSLPAFWARRARRLLPALFLVLGAVGIYALFIAPQIEGQQIANDGLSAFSYVTNWHFITSGQSYLQQFGSRAPSPLRHFWSLAIEEQFYLAWPLVVAGIGALVGPARRSGRGRRTLRRAMVGTCFALAGVSVLRMITLYHPGRDPSRVYYGTDTHASVLLLGAALGAISAGAPVIARAWQRNALVYTGCAALVGLGVVTALATTNSSWLYQGGYAIVGLVVVLVLAAAAQPGRNPLARIFETRALVGLGLISYGVYLWHWPMTIWLTSGNTGLPGPALFVARVVATLAVSLASYYLVEQPIRRGRLPRWRIRTPGVAPMVLVTAVALVLLVPALAFPTAVTAPTTTPSAAAFAATRAYESTPRCNSAPPAVAASPRPLRVQLVGNSLAAEIGPCLGDILKRRGAHLDKIVRDGDTICALAGGIKRRVDDPRTRPDAAVLFQLPLPTSFLAPGDRCRQQNWLTVLHSVITTWTRANVHVFLVPDVPQANKSTFDGTLLAYRSEAQQDPALVTVVDGGLFLRDTHGRYQWRMPCISGGEPGCASDGAVVVRWPVDGVHFCADPEWANHNGVCASPFEAGQQRVAAAVALQLFTTLNATPKTTGG